ncbi:MAG: hypothetical protein M1305_03430, partial [Candidatus Marsarchaeota archaeon]|nr:hypothetical protein [Candidatus Marsarchaeota archaeon]
RLLKRNLLLRDLLKREEQQTRLSKGSIFLFASFLFFIEPSASPTFMYPFFWAGIIGLKGHAVQLE